MKSVWTTHELTADGTRRDELGRRVAQGELIRLVRGVYSPATPLDAREAHLRLLAAQLSCLGPDAVASHASAASLHGLPVQTNLLGRAWVTRTAGSHGRTTTSLQQTSAALLPDELTTIEGIATTTAARTAADLATTASYPWAVAAWDALLHLTLATPDEAKQAAARLGRRRGARGARASLAFADHRAESVLESISRVQISRLGLPPPVLQHPIYLDGRLVARSDFGWPEFNLVGEADGLHKYADQAFDSRTGAEVIRDEKRREELIREAGWHICRWDWSTAHQLPALDKRIRAGLRHGAELRPVCRRPDVGDTDDARLRGDGVRPESA